MEEEREIGNCSQCGVELKAGERFCPNCGRPVSAVAKKHNPIMLAGVLITGVSLALWVGWPLLIPVGPVPGWTPWGMLIGAVILLVGYFT